MLPALRRGPTARSASVPAALVALAALALLPLAGPAAASSAAVAPAAATGSAPTVESGASPTATPSADAVAQARRAREQAQAAVEAFRAQVDAANASLAEGTARLEERQAELARTTAARDAADAEARAAVAVAEAARERLATMAAATFRSPLPDTVQLALTTGPEGIRDAVVARADLDRVRGTSTDAVREAKAARVAADAALRAAGQLTEAAAAQESAVAAEVAALAASAERTRATLEAAATALASAQAVERVAVEDAAARAAAQASAAAALEAARAAARGNRGVLATCTTTPPARQANGFLDPSTLCPLDDAPGHALEPEAAAAFNALNAASKAERGTALCVNDSYRSYAAQVDVYARKPQLAAVPGSSNHGWALAVDLGCGVERFGSEAHVWMRVNAGRFGWFHPAWAQQSGSKPEAWHWEFAKE